MTTIPASGAQAFAELHDEIAAVDAAQLVPISVDISFAHQIALAAADRIDALMPELEQLGGLDIERIRKLRMYAAASGHAHVRACAPEPSDRRLPHLLQEGAKLRQDLLATAELLAHFGDVSAKRVAAIRSGTGHIAIASGLERLAALFTEVWDRVASRVPITWEMIERAPVLAVELHTLLGAKTFRPITKVTDAQSMRQRAFTLLVHAYAECQSAVAFLRRNHGDAALFTPSMFLKERGRRASPTIRRTAAAASTAASAPTRLPIAERTATRKSDERPLAEASDGAAGLRRPQHASTHMQRLSTRSFDAESPRVTRLDSEPDHIGGQRPVTSAPQLKPTTNSPSSSSSTPNRSVIRPESIQVSRPSPRYSATGCASALPEAAVLHIAAVLAAATRTRKRPIAVHSNARCSLNRPEFPGLQQSGQLHSTCLSTAASSFGHNTGWALHGSSNSSTRSAKQVAMSIQISRHCGSVMARLSM